MTPPAVITLAALGSTAFGAVVWGSILLVLTVFLAVCWLVLTE
ncbi:hypothetical protein [Haloarcula japonica]|uniref:Uncharacterized protein n=1 Tax=Haloarcula japonica (strain ATCC 49778 / DSM 6131 / JCM 7785 / NBRC 101032 / NCIMB 13157 / TR-1) TaxID=1227453 RepID=M0LHP5_HALJT|nr:hypothetical protein [Haloarcula japonica]EMA33152.1 hypothetical protein C444_05156 [Haloarcula japonica DSM 6131]